MSDYLNLQAPIHIRQFDFYLNFPIKDKEQILQNLDVLFDGTVMGVKRSVVEKWLEEPLIREIKMGRKQFVKKDFEVKDEESLYRYLSVFVEE
jgi:hypothetical protein